MHYKHREKGEGKEKDRSSISGARGGESCISRDFFDDQIAF